MEAGTLTLATRISWLGLADPMSARPRLELRSRREPRTRRAGAAERPVTEEPEVLALVRQAAGGDANAFRELVVRHQDQVLALARRIVGSREAAEEVAQDSFVRAWRALPAFRGECRFSTWLYRIVVRRSLTEVERLRKRRLREQAMPVEAIEESVSDAVRFSGTDRVAHRDRLHLDRWIAELPEMQRASITLFYLQDRSIAEVAAALSVPEGTVKTWLHRSRAALRESWLRERAREERDGLRGV